MKKLRTALIVLAIVAVCGGGAFAQAKGKLKAAMLLSGPINDGGWNTLAYEGLQALKKDLGYEIAYTENVKQAEQKNILRNYAKKGYDLIIGHGFEYGDALTEVSAEFPKTAFYNVGGTVSGPNLGSGVFALGELSYLTGIVAAKFTKSNKIGFVGADEIPTITSEVDTIKKTVASLNPSATVSVAYTGSWTDVNKGKEAALAQIASGVDVIICIGDACDAGAIKAAEEKGAHVIGWSGDMNKLSPKTVLTSGVQSVQNLVLIQGKALAAGTWKAEAKVYGITEGTQFLGTWSKDVPDSLKKEVTAEFDKIKAGTLVKRSN